MTDERRIDEIYFSHKEGKFRIEITKPLRARADKFLHFEIKEGPSIQKFLETFFWNSIYSKISECHKAFGSTISYLCEIFPSFEIIDNRTTDKEFFKFTRYKGNMNVYYVQENRQKPKEIDFCSFVSKISNPNTDSSLKTSGDFLGQLIYKVIINYPQQTMCIFFNEKEERSLRLYKSINFPSKYKFGLPDIDHKYRHFFFTNFSVQYNSYLMMVGDSEKIEEIIENESPFNTLSEYLEEEMVYCLLIDQGEEDPMEKQTVMFKMFSKSIGVHENHTATKLKISTKVELE